MSLPHFLVGIRGHLKGELVVSRGGHVRTTNPSPPRKGELCSREQVGKSGSREVGRLAGVVRLHFGKRQEDVAERGHRSGNRSEITASSRLR